MSAITLACRSVANHLRDHAEDPYVAAIVGWLCSRVDRLERDGAALLEAAERHIFSDECLAERDAFRATLGIEAGTGETTQIGSTAKRRKPDPSGERPKGTTA